MLSVSVSGISVSGSGCLLSRPRFPEGRPGSRRAGQEYLGLGSRGRLRAARVVRTRHVPAVAHHAHPSVRVDPNQIEPKKERRLPIPRAPGDGFRAGVAADHLPNVTRALQQLEGRGLVKRVQDPVDRRVIRVFTTRKAAGIEEEMVALGRLWDDKLTIGFTPEERQTLVDLLLRMEVNARAMVREGKSCNDSRPSQTK